MHHSVNVIFKTDEQTKFGNVLNFAFNVRPNWMGFCKHFPWVALCLFQTQRHATLAAVDFQNHNVNFLRGRHNFSWVYVLLGPRHFRNVNQTFNTSFQFDECAIISNVGHTAFMQRFQRISRFNSIPWIRLQLFHTQADAVGVFVDFDDLNLNGFTNRQNLGWMVDATPCHVCNVQQTINTA